MKRKHWICAISCFIVVLAVLLAVILPNALVEAAWNKMDLCEMQIVLPQQPTGVEKTAANELKTYVRKMTGKTLPIVAEGAEVEAGIYVGSTEFSVDHYVTYPSTDFGEGWAIKAIDGNLVLTGDETRGVLYAVYHLLEDVLGVHWWREGVEYVPQTETALVPANYDDSGAPAMEYRDVYPGTAHAIQNTFCVRNRLNGWTSNPPANYGGEEDFGDPAHIHTFSRYITDSDFVTHPEWFSYVNGARTNDAQLCLSSEGLVAEMTKRVLESIRTSYEKADSAGIARPRYFSLTPNDRDGFCECSACQSAINRKGLSGYLLTFVNRIANVVAEEYPEALVETMAYWQFLAPPLDDTRAADNVVIRFGDVFGDHSHTLTHPNNLTSLQYLERWATLCAEGNLYVWDYPRVGGNFGILPNMYTFAENLRIMKELGVNGYFGELEDPISTDMWAMKFWMLAKLTEDPYQDPDELMDIFVNGYYGAGGVYVRKYLDRMDELTRDIAYDAHGLGQSYITVEDILFADNCFQEAMNAVQGDEVLLQRLRHARLCLDKLIVENFGRYYAQAKSLGISFDFNRKEVCQRVIDCLKEQIDLCGQWDESAESILNKYEGYYMGISADAPDEIKALESIHVFEANAWDFSLAGNVKVVADADAVGGYAAMLDTSELSSSERSAYLLTSTNGRKIPLNMYADATNAASSKTFGRLGYSDIKTNDGYHLYKFSNVKLITSDNPGYIWMFNWALQNRSLDGIDTAKNGVVDVYLSMKVTGTITGSKSSDYPVYYVDAMYVVETCDTYGGNEYTPNGDATCTSAGTETAVCDSCGKTHTREGSKKLDHAYLDVTNNGDGTKTLKCVNGCGQSYTVSAPGSNHSHSWSAMVYNQDATCATDGTQSKVCTTCGEKQTQVASGTRLEHNYGDYVSNNDATCTADGTMSRHCQNTNCNAKITITVANTKLPHTYGEFVYNRDAVGCVQNGTQTCTCTVCGDTYTTYAPNTKADHKYGTFVYNNNATCMADGTESATCSVCGNVGSRAVANTKLSHKFIDQSGKVVGYCVNPGCNEPNGTFDPLEDALNKAIAKHGLYGDYRVGSNLNDVAGVSCSRHPTVNDSAAVNRKAINMTGTVNAMGGNLGISIPGMTFAYIDVSGIPSNVGYRLAKATFKVPQGVASASYVFLDEGYCCVQSADMRVVLGKHEGEYVTVYASVKVVEQNGTKSYYLGRMVFVPCCTITEYTSNNDATCTEDGTKTGVCSGCGREDTVVDVGTKLGHNIVVDQAVPATCATSGLEEGKHCDRCGKVFLKQKQIPALGHDFTDENGKEVHQCLNPGCDVINLAVDPLKESLNIANAQHGLYADYRVGSNLNDVIANCSTHPLINDATAVNGKAMNMSVAVNAFGGNLQITTNTGVAVALIDVSSIPLNTGYRLAKATFTVPEGVANASYVFLDEGSCCVQSADMRLVLSRHVGENVTVYVSMKHMKVMGSDVYFMDRMIFVPACTATEYTYNNDATCMADGTETGYCACGNVVGTRTADGTKLQHNFVDENGRPVNTCLNPGCDEFKDWDRDEFLNVVAHHSVYADYNLTDVYGGGCADHPTVYDSAAAAGKAINMTSAVYGAGILDITKLGFGAITSIDVSGVPANTGYRIVKKTFTIPNIDYTTNKYITLDGGNAHIRLGGLCDIFAQRVGEQVTAYLSVKVDEVGGVKTYFMDRMVLVPPCSWTEYVSNNDATCRQNETKTRRCTVCGIEETVEVAGTMKSHHIVIDQAVPATCTETGLGQGKHCDLCNKVYWQQKLIPALGHKFTDENGKTVYNCQNPGCDERLLIVDPLKDAFENTMATHVVYGDYQVGSNLNDVFGEACGNHPAISDPAAVAGKAINMTSAVDRGQLYIQIPGLTFGAIDISNIDANMGYRLAKTTITIPAGVADAPFCFVDEGYNCVRSTDMSLVLGAHEGEQVIVFVSMKCVEENDTKTYYMDRLVFISPCTAATYTYNNDATCMADGTETGTCVCGNVIETRIAEGTKLPHDFTDRNGDFIVYCQTPGCDAIAPDPLEESFRLDCAHSFADYRVGSNLNDVAGAYCGRHATVSDPAAAAGKAINMTGPVKAFGGKIQITTNNQIVVGQIDVSGIPSNVGYRLAKATFTVPSRVASEVYCFLDEGYCCVQSADMRLKLGRYEGKQITAYVSMKCVEENGTISYYMDRVVFAELCTETVYTSDNNATCTVDGTKTGACPTCGRVVETIVDVGSAGHIVVTDAAVPATCTSTGLTAGEHCTRCDYKVGREIVGALGHNIVTDAAVPATCTETGLTAGEHCTRCDHKVAQTVVEALGHNYVGGVCGNCGDVIGITVSGTITHNGGTTGEVTIKLLNGETEVAAVTSTNGTYSLLAPGAGTYTLTVAQTNFVTRTYAITVADTEITLNVQIHLKGDVDGNGKVNTGDVSAVNRHAKRVETLTGYQLLCADANSDGRVNTGDVSAINKHAKRVQSLW